MFWKSISSRCGLPLLSSIRRHAVPSLQCTTFRSICNRSILRLDEFEREKKKRLASVRDIDSFWLRMFSLQDSGIAFEDDLKRAWLLAEKDHLPTLIEMTEIFTSKCANGSFGSFKFGSVMMRACYVSDSPDDALNIFKSEILRSWLREPISNIVLMDLLIESGRFVEAAEVYEELLKSEWFFALRNPIIPILYAISLYKQGTSGSFEKAHKFAKNLVLKLIYKQKVEDIIAALALKVKNAKIALALVQMREANSELAWNIMVQAIVLQSKTSDAVLKIIRQRNQHHLYKDTLSEIHRNYPDLAKSLKIQPVNVTVEEQVLGTIHVEEMSDIQPQRKRYY